MNNLRRVLAALISLSLSPAAAFAISPYSHLVRQTTRPQAVVPVAAVPSLPTAAAAVTRAAAAVPALGAAPSVASPASAAIPPALAAAVGPSASASSDPGKALDAAFDNSFAERAIELFHPSLPAGQTPGVAAKLTIPTQGVPSDDQLEARMRMSPLTNPEREAAVIKLYQDGGAAAAAVDVPRGQAPRLDLYDVIQRQDAGKGRHNLIVVKKGKSDRIVVVGAHHDKVHEGAGTIDNWTGATMVTNLYQAMKDQDTEATFVFVAFSREEEGLLGSQFFLDSLSKQEKKRIDSMVNLDTLGVDGTFSWGNNGTRWLLDRVLEVAAKVKRAVQEIRFWGGDADSSSFLHAGISAFTLLGASEAVIWDIIHSPNDTIAAFSLPHYRNAYLLTLELLKSLGQHPGKVAPGTN